jgi:inorganic pyrophosphatase
MLTELPERPRVCIEVSRWGVVKPRSDGALDFISPFPCPYNYGSIAGFIAPDGDPLDAVVLGPRLSRGTSVEVAVRGVMGFVDAGRDDPKVICSARALTRRDRRGVERFFQFYALCKGLLNRLRGESGATRCTGWLDVDVQTSR